MKCPNCHASIENGDVFCPECGGRIERTGRFNLAAVIIALIVLAAIVSGIMFWLFSGKQDTLESDTNITSETEVSESEAKNKSSEITKTEKNEKDNEAEDTVKEDKAEQDSKDTAKKSASEYILPQSDSGYLTDSDVQGMTAQQLNYAKNEIYARHGRRFDSPELQNYFNSKSWYTGKYDPKDFDANYSDSLLSDIEKKNAEFLRDREYKLAPSGYQLDQ